MKILMSILFVLSLSIPCYSGTHYATGKIASMRSHTSFWQSDSWIQIEGFNGIEGCEEANHDKGVLTYIVVPKEETQLYSMLLAAFMSKQEVEVYLDDAVFTHNLCTIKFATIKS